MAEPSESRRLNFLLTRARIAIEPHSETPSLDAQLLMMGSLGMPRGWILAHPEAELDPGQVTQFQRNLGRYLEGEALPHVLGWWDFYGRRFHLSGDVLVPRPETEHLVEVGLSRLAARPDARLIAEVGTGSGCVVVSLAAEFTDRRYLASDVSLPALSVASRNVHHYGLEGCIRLVQADLLRGLGGPFDIILANLPYIRRANLRQLEVAKREPILALDGGEDGLALLRRLSQDLDRLLAGSGDLILELDPDQMEMAEVIVSESLPVAESHRYLDLSGRERVLNIRRGRV